MSHRWRWWLVSQSVTWHFFFFLIYFLTNFEQFLKCLKKCGERIDNADLNFFHQQIFFLEMLHKICLRKKLLRMVSWLKNLKLKIIKHRAILRPLGALSKTQMSRNEGPLKLVSFKNYCNFLACYCVPSRNWIIFWLKKHKIYICFSFSGPHKLMKRSILDTLWNLGNPENVYLAYL